MKRDGSMQRALFAQQLALAPLIYIPVWDAPSSPTSLPNLPPQNPSFLQQRYAATGH
jgi:hypothetical protein